MNINVAICDDTTIIAEDLKKHIESKFGSVINKIYMYENGAELINDVKEFDTSFDIVFLDLDMPVLNGQETAKELRKFANHENTKIIFCTGYEIYASEIIDCRPYGYITKPVDYDKLDALVDKALASFNTTDFLVAFSKVNKHLVLDSRKILYIRSKSRACIFYTTEGTHSFKMGVSQVYEILNSKVKTFAQIHSSYLVNMAFIQNINSSKIILSSNDELPVGRKFHSDFLIKFGDFMLDR